MGKQEASNRASIAAEKWIGELQTKQVNVAQAKPTQYYKPKYSVFLLELHQNSYPSTDPVSKMTVYFWQSISFANSQRNSSKYSQKNAQTLYSSFAIFQHISISRCSAKKGSNSRRCCEIILAMEIEFGVSPNCQRLFSKLDCCIF